VFDLYLVPSPVESLLLLCEQHRFPSPSTEQPCWWVLRDLLWIFRDLARRLRDSSFGLLDHHHRLQHTRCIVGSSFQVFRKASAHPT
jgi:hypothetical protein